MPIYEYRCKECGTTRCYTLPVADRDTPFFHCGEQMDRLITAPMIRTDGVYSYKEGSTDD